MEVEHYKTEEDAKPRIVSLCLQISPIFQQAQTSVANHNKNSVALYKTFEQLAHIGRKSRKEGYFKTYGETPFKEAFEGCFTRSLGVKKGEASADRVAKFVGAFIKHLNEKGQEKLADLEGDRDDDSDKPKTAEARFTRDLLSLLMQGFGAAKKDVRFRCVHALSEMLKHLGALNFSTYQQLRSALLDRLNDKESIIRAQTAAALGFLVGTDEDVDLEVYDSLFDLLASDTVAEVRKAILLGVRVDEMTLPFILQRLRDVDPTIRKTVYTTILKPRVFKENADGDGGGGGKVPGPCHPTVLSTEQRLDILKGLKDPDRDVRKSADALLVDWITAYGEGGIKPESVLEVLVTFLRDFKVGRKGRQTLDILALAMRRTFKAREDIFDTVSFGDHNYWKSGPVRPEDAFNLRVFSDLCHNSKRDEKLDDILPSVTEMSDIIRSRYITLKGMYDEDTDTPTRVPETILGDILQMARLLDFGDHNGARKMRQVIRDMLVDQSLTSDRILESCVEVLAQLTDHDRDLLQTIAGIIQEIRRNVQQENRDLHDNEPEQNELSNENIFHLPRKDLDEATRFMLNSVDVKCLRICKATLERIESTFPQSDSLNYLNQQLIIPCIEMSEAWLKDNKDDPLYEIILDLGLISLTLAAVIAPPIAYGALKRLSNALDSKTTPAKTALNVFRGIFDLMQVHSNKIIPPESETTFENMTETILSRFYLADQDPTTIALVCHGLAKLIMCETVKDMSVVAELFRMFAIPSTADNKPLQDCLGCFFEVWTAQSADNQHTMQETFVPVYKVLAIQRKESGIDVPMAHLTKLCNMFEHYTDPDRISNKDTQDEVDSVMPNSQVDLVYSILQALFEKREREDLQFVLQRDDKKALFQSLKRLGQRLPEHVDDLKVYKIKTMANKLEKCRPPSDAVSKTAFGVFQREFDAKFKNKLASMDDEEYYKLEELQEHNAFLADAGDGEDIVEPGISCSRKRRSMSSASEIEDIKPVLESTPAPSAKRRKRTHANTADLDDVPSVRSTPAPPRPRPQAVRRKPRPSRGPPNPDDVICISSDSDEGEPSLPSRAPRNGSGAQIPPRPSEIIKLEVDEDEDNIINEDLSNSFRQSVGVTEEDPEEEPTFDSIMDTVDTDDDEEEAEVMDSVFPDSESELE